MDLLDAIREQVLETVHPKISKFLFVIFPPESVWEKDYFTACLLAHRPLPRSVRRFHARIQATRLPARRPPPRSVRRFRASKRAC